MRVLKEEMRLAGLAGYSGLKKADLVARIWGLVEVTSRNAGALEQAQEMGILSGAKGGPVSWRHFERVESALDEEGEGELRREACCTELPEMPLPGARAVARTHCGSSCPCRPGDRGSGEKRPHGKADLPPSDALADACGRFLSRGRCQDILMIDMKPVCHWTDFMLIATAANEQHVWRATKGLMYQLKRWMPECRWGDVLVDGHSGTDWVNIELIPRVTCCASGHRALAKLSAAPNPRSLNTLLPLPCCAQGVVNVMTAEARAHYDLEENWVDEKLNNAYKYQGDEPEKRTFTLDELAA